MEFLILSGKINILLPFKAYYLTLNKEVWQREDCITELIIV